MRILTKNSIIVLLAVFFALGLSGPRPVLAASTPSLGAAATFGVLSSTFTNSNTAPQTVITGDIGYSVAGAPTTPPITVSGSLHPEDATWTLAGANQATALTNLNTQSCTTITGPLDATVIGANAPGIFPPGCYTMAGPLVITLNTSITLDLTASGGVGSTWIFKSTGGGLTTGADSFVTLAHGASACDVFWVPVGAANIGAYTGALPNTAKLFIGTIIDAAGIGLGHFANLSGRALAFGGTVTTDANTITVPTCTVPPATLHVIKLVVNGSGGTGPGTLTPSDFNVHVKSAGLDVAGSPLAGAAAPGTSYSLAPGTYQVSEDSNASYVQSFFGADCAPSAGSVTLASGDDKICTIINTDIPVIVPNPAGGGNSGNYYSTPVIVPLIGITKVPSPLALPAGPASVTYNYTVWNVGGQVALTGVTVTDDKCGQVNFLSGDINNNGKLDITENWKYSCSIRLSQTTINTAIATGYSDDPSHQSAIATAVATVVVGAPLIPPLINIVKVPSILTPLPFGGGRVSYAYTVTNPGTAPMNNVTVTDDKCGPVSFISGDLNSNNLLEPGEAWKYTCVANVTTSTRNIATALGRANGFTATGYAFATVLVSVPGTPSAGLPPDGKNAPRAGIAMLFGLAVFAYAAFRFLKKRFV